MKQMTVWKEKEVKESGLGKLKRRDLEILKFILEMKFVSLNEVYNQFFRVKQNGKPSKSSWWARDRVYQLKKLGLLRSINFFTEQRSFYVVTDKGHRILSKDYPVMQFCKPIRDIDVRTFHHDWLVTKSRVALDNSGRVMRWISERQLKAEHSFNLGIAKKYMPDGLFENPEGELVAFELELSLKAKARYQHKVKLYRKLMSGEMGSRFEKFDRCLFVCRKESVAQHLKRLTLPFGSRFEIIMLNELAVESFGAGVQ